MPIAARSRPGPRPIRRAVCTAATAAVFLTVLGCDDATGDQPTPAEYTAEMSAICEATAARLDQLPSPPAEISTADFATEAAAALEDEAEQVRTVEPPDELDGDHRAFIANTEDQARAWRAIAEAGGADVEELNAASERIGQLTLGRDDLSTEMGIDACRRADA